MHNIAAPAIKPVAALVPNFDAPKAVQEVTIYFDHAAKILDDKWGEGYSKKNPSTVAALVNSMVLAN